MATNREIMFLFKARDAARAVIKGMGTNFKQVGKETQKTTKTTVELESKHKRLRAEISKLKKSQAQIRKARDEMNKFKKSIDGARNASRGLSSIKLGGLVGAVSVGLVVRDALSTYAGFEQQLAAVGAVSNATDAELKALTETAKELGATTEFTGKQAGEGLEFLVRAGFSAKQAITALPATLDLATAAAIDLGRSSDIVSNIMATFQIPIDQTSRATDILATVNSSANTNVLQLAEAMKFAGPIASGFGVNINETAAAIGVLGDSGLQGSLAGTGIRMALIDAKMLAAGTNTRRAQEAFDKLGIPKDKIDPEKNGLNGMIKSLRDAGATTEDLVTIFGARAAPAVLTLIRGYDKLNSLTQKTIDNVGESARQAAAMRDTLLGDWRALRSAIEGAFIKIGELIGPALRGTVQAVTAIVQALQGAEVSFKRFEVVAQATAKALKLAFNFVALVAAVKVASLALKGLSVTMGVVTGGATGAAGALRLIPGALRLIGVAIRAVPILGWIVIAVEGIQQLMKTTFKWKDTTISVRDVMKTIWSKMTSFITGFTDAAKKRFGEFVQGVKDAAAKISGALEPIRTAFTSVLGFVKTTINTLVGGVFGLVEAIRVILSNLPAVFKGAFQLALNGAVQLMEDGLNKILNGLKSFLGAIDAAVQFVGGSSDLASKIGSVELGKLKVEISDDAKALPGKIKQAFVDSQQDYVGQIGDITKNAVSNAKDAALGVLTPVLDETAARIREAGQSKQDDARARRTGATSDVLTAPVTPPKDPNNTGGGGGSSSDKASKLKDIVGDIVNKNKETVQLARFWGRELDLQKVQLEAINAAKAQGTVLSKEELATIRETTNAALNAQQAREIINGYGGLFKDTFSNGLKSALDEGKLNFKSFLSTFGQQLRNMAIDNFVNIISNSLSSLGGAGGASAGGGGGFFGSIIGGLGSFFGGGGGGGGFAFKDGGIMSSAGRIPINTYSKGGIANSPQLSIFGEGSVPEAYVPVPSGRIPVEMKGGQGGGNTTIQMNITTPDANSFRKSQPQIMADLQRELNRQGRRNN
jgi:TP901 family phage tail tape measure protein